jgi:uncharacterized protein with FMN-binding domain
VIKGGRKGRISNELVAASCAAILAVYAAGTWRTRDEARRFGVDGEMRRPARPAQVPAAALPAPAAVAASIAEPAPQVSAAAINVEAQPHLQPAAEQKTPGPMTPVKVDAAPTLPAVASKQAAKPDAAVVAAVETKAEPATATTPTAEVVAAPDEGQPPATIERRWKDGYYTGWGQSRHGDIQAFVRITDGEITEAGIATCETRYPCSVIEDILMQPVALQGPDVDKVSRATESADAYYYGLVMALENAETGTRRSVRP